MWKLFFLFMGLAGFSAKGAEAKAFLHLYPQAGLDNTFALSPKGVVGGMTLDSDPKKSPSLWLAQLKGKKQKRVAIAGLETLHVVTMQPKGTVWYLLGVTPPPKFETSVVKIGADGKVLQKWAIENTVQDRPTGLVVLDDGVLVYGTTVKLDKSRDGWILRLKDGKKVWERKLDRGRDEAFLQAVPLGKDWLFVGDSGKLNRFGQGPSRVWIYLINQEGDTVREAFIEGGRINSRGQPVAAVVGQDVFVSYTNTELPEPRRGVPPDFTFTSLLARLDPQFKALWQKKVGATTDPGTAMLLEAGGKLHLVGTSKTGIWAKQLGVDGKEVAAGSTKVEGRLSLVDFFKKGNRLSGIGQVMRFPSKEDMAAKGAPPVEQDFFFFRFVF